jgi:alkaline phosphatase D
MLSDELDAIVHVGDYIYEHTWGANLVRHHGSPEVITLDDYRARYALYKSDPDLAAAHAAYPWFVTWDDHEVENDYAGDLSENRDDPEWFLARRAAAYRAFYEHMPLPPQAVPFGPSMRLYTAQSFGKLVSLSMLDGRQYRSPLACPRPGRAGSNRVTNCVELEASGRTMLGQRQEEWLQAQLTTHRAQWNLMAQGVVMAYIDEDPGPDKTFWTDGWNGYPAARARLMNCLTDARVSNPVVLSGDIHAFVISGLHARAAELDSPVVASEVVTTSISSQALAQKTLDAWSKVNPNLLLATSEHRGYARLDITPQRLLADLIVVESVQQPDAGCRTLRSFAVENGRPAPIGA